LVFLLEVTPTARRLLGAQSRDLLSPLWGQLADAVRGAPFDPNEPALHRSFALCQAQDWPAVGDSVLSESGWQEHAALCLRLAESSFNRRQRVPALAAWCQVCWRAPAEASQAVGKLRQPELTTLWQRFLDDEPDADGAARDTRIAGSATGSATLTESDFPAWLLLNEPGLALPLAEDLATGTPAEESYRCVHRWIHARRARKQADELALRKNLQAIHPALFRVLKESV
jgi:hypothetical protein